MGKESGRLMMEGRGPLPSKLVAYLTPFNLQWFKSQLPGFLSKVSCCWGRSNPRISETTT